MWLIWDACVDGPMIPVRAPYHYPVRERTRLRIVGGPNADFRRQTIAEDQLSAHSSFGNFEMS